MIPILPGLNTGETEMTLYWLLEAMDRGGIQAFCSLYEGRGRCGSYDT